MNRKQFLHWLRRLYATTENEMDCDQFQVCLPALIDCELENGEPGKHFAPAMAHALQCPDCAEEYRGLREVARLEVHGRLPQVDEVLSRFEETSVETRVPERA